MPPGRGPPLPDFRQFYTPAKRHSRNLAMFHARCRWHGVCSLLSARCFMIVLKNILVATDFGEPSEAALTYGRDLARTFGATLHVLHVVEDIAVRFANEGSTALFCPSCRRKSKTMRGNVSKALSLMRTGRRSTPRPLSSPRWAPPKRSFSMRRTTRST